jgi:hypothetical protein
VDYNTVRPHSSLRYLTPEEFAASVAARPERPPRRSSLSTPHGPDRICRNRGVLTYDSAKNGEQVTCRRINIFVRDSLLSSLASPTQPRPTRPYPLGRPQLLASTEA